MKAKIELLIIPAVFTLTIFVQCVLFHYLIYKEILFSSLWHSPEDFFRFYLPAATMAVFFSSFVFLLKNKWWTVVVSLLFDVWIFANLWYYRANGILIDKYTIGMIGNLNGYWDSILALIRPIDFLYIALTLSISIIIYIFRKKGTNKSIKSFTITVILTIVMGLTNGVLLVKKYEWDWSYMNPFKSYNITTLGYRQWKIEYYIQDHSIIHYIVTTFRDFIQMPNEEKAYKLTNEDIQKISSFIQLNDNKITPKNKLIICIIESFNTFAFTKEFMPNLFNFVDTTNSTLFVPHIVSQAKGGSSGDGQMIIQSGLLPVKLGAACLRFPFNIYPSLSKQFNNSLGIFPNDLNAWNQEKMSKAYKIDTNLVFSDNDKELFSKTVFHSQEFSNIMMITMASHIPCTKYADSSQLTLPNTNSTLLNNYIKSINVTDKGIKYLVDAVSSNQTLYNSTIVITGDHCLPIPADEDFGGAYGYSRFIPLIIYSPEIKQKTIITDTCYQMDIYPTILHLIGCEDYYWKGFGVNLLDSVARHNRPITPEEAYDLSDKMIRADFFRKFEE